MSTIRYEGIFKEDGHVFSCYLLNSIHGSSLRTYRDAVSPPMSFHLHGDTKQYETLVVRYYMKKELPLLFQWLTEMKISHGGIVEPLMYESWHNIKLLLLHNSQEDLAFRLCYNVRMAESS
jgi:hypothetical protein